MKERFLLKNKVIVVTGGTGVLGSEFVKAIIKAGGKVGILKRDSKKEAPVISELKKLGADFILVEADVLDEKKLNKAKESIISHFGNVDGLVNAAGGNLPDGVVGPDDDIFSINIKGMEKAMYLNTMGSIITNQVFGPELVKSGHGSIVNISSVSSKRPLTRVLGYGMGKAALDSYTKWMSVEMANRHGEAIRINSITPGFFHTRQNHDLLKTSDGNWTDRAQKILSHTPFGRFGNPEELCGALIWLLSDASSFVTGMDVCVDGGFTINSGV